MENNLFFFKQDNILQIFKETKLYLHKIISVNSIYIKYSHQN